MCSKCGTYKKIIIRVKPIEIEFTIAVGKSGKWRRIGDFSARQLFDPDEFLSNMDKIIAVCACGAEVSLLDLPIPKICSICGTVSDTVCKYNDIFICKECVKGFVHYCKSCPFLSDCSLGRK